MLENFQVGDVVEGKVTGIKPFGAFVAIDEKHQGLVHISEVAHGYVKDIQEHLSVGEEVKVKILSIDQEAGKISLSIRKTQAPPSRGGQKKEKDQGFNTLEQKLKDWLKESNEKQAQLNKRLKK